MDKSSLKDFLDDKVVLYNNSSFIKTDPIQIPHQFTLKEDIEIIGFLVATIAWGNRTSIIKNSEKLVEILGNSPYQFVMDYSEKDREKMVGFVHRTFNDIDLIYFIKSLQNIYKNHGGLEGVFTKHQEKDSIQNAIVEFKKLFFQLPHSSRTQKHLSDPSKNSAAKRINMFLRWMVRKDNAGVDFGIWQNIPSSVLSCPLDIHTGNMARKLGILRRKQNDAKAVRELDLFLREMDPSDPVKYDFALFGLGAFEKF